MLLALASGLESGEESYGEKAEEGTTQGDPLSGPYFCVVIHKLVRKAELILRNSVGMVRYGWDDGYLLGKKKKVFQALEEISRQVQMRSGLMLQAFKLVLYALLTGDMSWICLPGVIQAGDKQGGQFHPGFLCYGVPIP